jgi:hypothetical protein
MSLAIPGVRVALSVSPRVVALSRASPATRGYIAAVEAADGQPLENKVLSAIIPFANYRIPLGGACYLMAGARTLAGALVPMVGPVPTAYNFVSGDYFRATGLQANGINQEIDTNRSNAVDGRDDSHNAVYASVIAITGSFMGGPGAGANNGLNVGFHRNRCAGIGAVLTSPGLIGTSRSNSAEYTLRHGGVSTNIVAASDPIETGRISVFTGPGPSRGAHRISYYSSGPNADLAVMDTQITALMNALAAAGI